MKLKISTAGLARSSAQHPWRTVGIWLTILVASIAVTVTMLGGALSVETSLTNNPESAQAENLLLERLDGSDTLSEVVIVRSSTLTVDDPAFRSYVENLYGTLSALGVEVIAGGTHYYLTGDESLVSADRMTTLLPLAVPEDGREHVDQIHQIVDAARVDGSFTLLVTGAATLDVEISEIAEKDLVTGEGIGISAALVILALVLGAVAAAILPILLAIVAIAVALGATALVGQAIDLPFFVTNMITMMGLAVGIDYSLFIVSRYREERAKGKSKFAAIEIAGATAGRTVLISGMTVVLTLVGLLMTPDSSNQAIGVGGILVVLGAMIASMTLLPAMLGLLGDKIDAIRIPFVNRRGTAQPGESRSGFWNWTTRVVMGRPVISFLVAASLLLIAASSYVDIDQGEVGMAALPDSMMSKEAFLVLEQEFGYGQDLPAEIVIDGPTDDESVMAAVASVQASIASDPAFVTTSTDVHPENDLIIIRAWIAGDPVGKPAMNAIERLRANYVRTAFNDVPATAWVGGRTAELVDQAEVTETYTPIVFSFVLGLSFILLTVSFRSIVIAIKAILMNLLSVGATYGLLVLVFQKGVGTGLLGFQQVDVIQTGLPLFLFVVLFGLSMDYHVFLLSRIRERFMETGNNAEAVEYGLRSTGRLITGAALIMVAVFGGFAMGELVAMQQFGFGLAVAVVLDATIVRTILVPASMRLLGNWNWYLPTSLHWLPEFRVELPAPAQAAD